MDRLSLGVSDVAIIKRMLLVRFINHNYRVLMSVCVSVCVCVCVCACVCVCDNTITKQN